MQVQYVRKKYRAENEWPAGQQPLQKCRHQSKAVCRIKLYINILKPCLWLNCTNCWSLVQLRQNIVQGVLFHISYYLTLSRFENGRNVTAYFMLDKTECMRCCQVAGNYVCDYKMAQLKSGSTFLRVIDPSFFLWTHKFQLKLTITRPLGRSSIHNGVKISHGKSLTMFHFCPPNYQNIELHVLN